MVAAMKQLRFVFLLAAIVPAGLWLGYGIHRILANDFLKGGRGYILAAVPSDDIIRVFKGIQSANENERSASYYEIGRLRLADTALLKEAYAVETVPFVKSVILFTMKQIDPSFWKDFCATIPAAQKPRDIPDRRRTESFIF